VIADLHLDLGHPRAAKPFLDWLARNPRLPGLVVLGDFFDVWVGPAQEEMPARRRCSTPCAQSSPAARASTSSTGTATSSSMRRSSAAPERRSIRSASSVATTAPRRGSGRSRRADPRRRAVHARQGLHPAAEGAALRDRSAGIAPRLPLSVATFVARSLRRTSARAVDRKPPDTKIVQEAACRWHATAYHADTVVCGHAHRLPRHAPLVRPRWIVLDAFGGDRDVLEFGADGEIRVSRSA
jgi:UDP-2,3-diacylglucosamine pyrophosphatase LpxH